VIGLPGSGRHTLAKQLSEEHQFTLVDNEESLKASFEKSGLYVLVNIPKTKEDLDHIASQLGYLPECVFLNGNLEIATQLLTAQEGEEKAKETLLVSFLNSI